MTYQEACRVTPAEFVVYQKAFEIERQEFEYRSAVSAWLNQSVKATKGKSGKPTYRKLSDFYDNTKKFNKLFEKKGARRRRVSLADLNRLTNKKEGGQNG